MPEKHTYLEVSGTVSYTLSRKPERFEWHAHRISDDEHDSHPRRHAQAPAALVARTARVLRVEPLAQNTHPGEDLMPLARCPDCDELVEIAPNGKDPATTFRRPRSGDSVSCYIPTNAVRERSATAAERTSDMPKFVDEDIIRAKPVSDAYREGWDRVFGEKAEEPAEPRREFPIHCEKCGERIGDYDIDWNAPYESNECEIRNTCTGHLNCPRR